MCTDTEIVRYIHAYINLKKQMGRSIDRRVPDTLLRESQRMCFIDVSPTFSEIL